MYPDTTRATDHIIDLDQQPPPFLPFPPEIDDDEDDDDTPVTPTLTEFDEKWNLEHQGEDQEREETVPRIEKSMPGTMVLVIGIILGAFVAMVLIVIIVLKIRVRVDGNIKCEEAAPRYQFAPPNDYGEVGGEQETATTSLMEGSVAPPGPPQMGHGGPPGMYNNGMFNNNCPPRAMQQPPMQQQQQPPPPSASNGDRSRLFRKSNGSKPVREWYV